LNPSVLDVHGGFSVYHYEKLVFQRDGRWHALLIITTRGDGCNRIVDFGHFQDEMAARTALNTGIALHRRDLKYNTEQFDQYVKSLLFVRRRSVSGLSAEKAQDQREQNPLKSGSW